jgi:hypothetical protein
MAEADTSRNGARRRPAVGFGARLVGFQPLPLHGRFLSDEARRDLLESFTAKDTVSIV